MTSKRPYGTMTLIKGAGKLGAHIKDNDVPHVKIGETTNLSDIPDRVMISVETDHVPSSVMDKVLQYMISGRSAIGSFEYDVSHIPKPILDRAVLHSD